MLARQERPPGQPPQEPPTPTAQQEERQPPRNRIPTHSPLAGYQHGCASIPQQVSSQHDGVWPAVVGLPKLNCEPFAGSWCYEEGADGWGCGSCQPGESPLDMQSYGCVLSVCMHTDLVFNALADPTRRLMLDELSERNEQTLYELTARLGVSPLNRMADQQPSSIYRTIVEWQRPLWMVDLDA